MCELRRSAISILHTPQFIQAQKWRSKSPGSRVRYNAKQFLVACCTQAARLILVSDSTVENPQLGLLRTWPDFSLFSWYHIDLSVRNLTQQTKSKYKVCQIGFKIQSTLQKLLYIWSDDTSDDTTVAMGSSTIGAKLLVHH